MASDVSRLRAFLELFAVGRNKAMRQAKVASELGLSTRKVQELMVELVEVEGFVVCSACDVEPMGIYIPRDAREANGYLHQLRSRAIGNLRHYSRIKKALGKTEYQDNLFEEARA